MSRKFPLNQAGLSRGGWRRREVGTERKERLRAPRTMAPAWERGLDPGPSWGVAPASRAAGSLLTGGRNSSRPTGGADCERRGRRLHFDLR